MFWQVCYTSVPGKGWTTLNVSSGLPSEANAQFSRLHGAYAQEPELHREDKRTLYLLHTDTYYVYYSAVRYGFMDAFGRASMFAQGFVFPIAEFTANPDVVLSMPRSNFRYGIEETSTDIDFPTLSPLSPISIPESLRRLGFDADKFSALMQCIWHSYERRVSEPIRIVCDCQEETIRVILLAVCAALPEQLRKQLSYASAECARSGSETRIVFVRPSSSSGRQFDIETGEETVLSRAAKRQLETCDFITDASAAVVYGNAATTVYEKLDDELSKYGAKGSMSLELLSFAQAELKRPIYDDEPSNLLRQLSDYLSINLPNRIELDTRSAKLLNQLLDIGYAIDSITAEKLLHRLNSTDNLHLQKAGLRYITEHIKSLPEEEACAYISESCPDRSSAGFKALRAELEQDQAGKDLIGRYYQTEIAPKIMITTSLDCVAVFKGYYDETQELKPRKDYEKQIKDWLKEYYLGRQEHEQTPGAAIRLIKDASIVVVTDFPDLQVWIETLQDEIRKQFWEKFVLSSFNIADVDISQYFDDLRHDDSATSRSVGSVLSMVDRFKMGDYEGFLDDILQFSGDKTILNQLVKFCLERKNRLPLHEIHFWYELVIHLYQDPWKQASFLIDNKIPAFSDQNFPTAIDVFRSKYPDCVPNVIHVLSIYAENKSPEGKRVASLVDYYRRSEKKRLQRQRSMDMHDRDRHESGASLRRHGSADQPREQEWQQDEAMKRDNYSHGQAENETSVSNEGNYAQHPQGAWPLQEPPKKASLGTKFKEGFTRFTDRFKGDEEDT